MKLLEVEEDPDVAGSRRESGRCWKWKRTQMQLLEVEEDPDVVGKGSERSCWKWIWMKLLEGDPDAVAGSGRRSRGC